MTSGVRVAAKGKAEVPGKHTVAKVILVSTLVLALVTALSVVFLVRHLEGNLDVEDLTPALGNDRPERSGPEGALNILVMGSDSREGEGNGIDTEDPDNGARSDMTLLLHLSADRERAYGISIPRDSLVTRPDCGEDDEIPGGDSEIWNVAFAVGGPACTIRQVEATTGVFIDNYVLVDFNGFKDMVDAVGGVPVCVPVDIEDPKHGISVAAGEREIRGDEALDYVRVRSTVGNQSDLGRIKRQQTFMAAMIKKVMSAETLTRPDRLVRFLNAATKSVKLDFESIRDLAGLGLQLQDIGLDKVQFVTVPWEYTPEYRVLWRPEAKQLWRKVIADEPLSSRQTDTAVDAAEAPGPGTPSPTPTDTETLTPDETAAEANGLCT
ncbi:MAG: LytR family transcriptional regulator [Nocardioides sp.]|uniref:LCP family protein n=1 Tax=Nocardioides sp. TaxID=35761 RepID=UPI0026210E8F|nr:LCP family protein [Nocardioides sp.]MCW2835596.1 LytR family transcriptional regulator [Nocardioides sp.]